MTGTTIAPSRSAPKYASTNDGAFGSTIATRSPGPDAVAGELAAARSTRAPQLRVGDGRPLVDQGRRARVTRGSLRMPARFAFTAPREQSQVI